MRAAAELLWYGTVVLDQAKGGLWERCAYDPQMAANQCEVYNWRGGVLYNEEFLPCDRMRNALPVDVWSASQAAGSAFRRITP